MHYYCLDVKLICLTRYHQFPTVNDGRKLLYVEIEHKMCSELSFIFFIYFSVSLSLRGPGLTLYLIFTPKQLKI